MCINSNDISGQYTESKIGLGTVIPFLNRGKVDFKYLLVMPIDNVLKETHVWADNMEIL